MFFWQTIFFCFCVCFVTLFIYEPNGICYILEIPSFKHYANIKSSLSIVVVFLLFDIKSITSKVLTYSLLYKMTLTTIRCYFWSIVVNDRWHSRLRKVNNMECRVHYDFLTNNNWNLFLFIEFIITTWPYLLYSMEHTINSGLAWN